MSKERIFDTAREWLDGNASDIAALTDRIWEYAEPSFCEERSAKALCGLLSANGFSVEMGVAHMPSAFVASYGTGRPRIAVMCEYDATPGEVQAPVAYPQAQPGRTSGFTDLHNGIGVASAAAAVAVARAVEANGIAGSVVVLGTPAEKLCAGKPMVAQAGLFEGLDAIVAWHPRPTPRWNGTWGPPSSRARFIAS